MRKIFYSLVGSMVAASILCVPTSAISLAPCPDDENKAECEAQQTEILRRQEAGEPTPRSVDGDNGEKSKVAPTFVTELDESHQSIGLWAGKSLLLAGNNLTTSADVKNGLLLVAGNNLYLENNAEYGFIFGNIIKFAGTTQRDFYAAGNSITLSRDAKIGRDVFVASGELRVETDLAGDLSVTADRIIIDDGIEIKGNVNIDADTIEVGDGVKIGGKLVYNDNARTNGIDGIDYGELETYHLEEVSAEARFAAAFYSKFLSIAGLFLVMALMIALYSGLHDKVQTETSAGHFATNLAIGLGALIIVPVVAVFAFLTVVAAPLGVLALLAYFVALYLAQGFTGLWLGHLIIEKLFKLKGNAFIEALIGIIVLGLLALVPFVGVVTGFLSMALGLGLIVSCIKPSKADKASKKLTKNTKTAKTARK